MKREWALFPDCIEMLRIPCPVCGLRDETEFVYGGDASFRPPELDSKADAAAWTDAVFLRDNPRGPHREWWQHIHGCRQWLTVERDTQTHEIQGAALARAGRDG